MDSDEEAARKAKKKEGKEEEAKREGIMEGGEIDEFTSIIPIDMRGIRDTYGKKCFIAKMMATLLFYG